MSDYAAPLRDMQFVLTELAGLPALSQLPGCQDVGVELVMQVLEENARFSREVLAPLNLSGEVEGARWHDGGKVSIEARCLDAQHLEVRVCDNGIGINALTSAEPGWPNGGAVFHDTAVWIRALSD